MKQKKPKKPFAFYIGNLLMLFSALLLLYIYYPYIMLFVFTPKVDNNIIKNGTYIQIPKINAQAPIFKDINPWKEADYRPVLEKGVAQAKGTAFPPQNGTIYIFAHSSDLPWRIARYNTIFLRLGELTKGDIVKIFDKGKQYNYKVMDKKTVWPNEIKYLEKNQENKLILQTCTPIGTSLMRLLVFAVPIK
ncbi:MAG: hypothetical protein CO135_02590 [Candidatus Levybacteria bacterium CG_4_9_14_3_um_filter_35_16]|nr:MAG: hypothetical protein COW87_02355 [Candidatus Levybacteria bacterium CG22_combo_CG10-13_8_21_14_all_35_11]PIY94403.1 MAG: hypothetical protein COY68_02480 [Candidatus Levybacteria bacterium CG_4_10_14_0_8_um_filter_35_23]PJA00531.1 MAG: hypothetical protein COX78_00415 [Candidatus Levybacteria bacterium CG_4_10_14_0_2_um_filter_35_8]PJA91150.1 MAG: hypothetical protein CO135_02590 [Candidatus Levybacteria bacterium CG_4_9_14_3_um_filter_35_16]PJC54028.1 MAG: hypothetical protein CO028_04